MKIACLHTLEANAALFDAACPADVELEHHTREDLLNRAIEQREATEEDSRNRGTFWCFCHASFSRIHRGIKSIEGDTHLRFLKTIIAIV